MKSTLEHTDNLVLKQEEATALIVEDKVIKGVETNLGVKYYAKAVILATGVYLKSKSLSVNILRKLVRLVYLERTV